MQERWRWFWHILRFADTTEDVIYLNIEGDSCTASGGTQSGLVILTANADHDFLQPLTRQLVKDRNGAPIKRRFKKTLIFLGRYEKKLAFFFSRNFNSLVSLFKGISTLMHYLMPKPSFKKNYGVSI